MRGNPLEACPTLSYDLSGLNLHPENILPPAKGRLLVSAPFLQDPYFTRSVILLCESDKEGAFGFILNKYIDINLEDLVNDLPDFGAMVSMGGPVQSENLFYIHTLGEELPGSIPITPELSLGGDFDMLRSGIIAGSIEPRQIRFFVGYSGWSAGQLEDEMSQKSWYVSEPGELPLMESDRVDIWGQTLSQMGGDFAKLANIPADPSMN